MLMTVVVLDLLLCYQSGKKVMYQLISPKLFVFSLHMVVRTKVEKSVICVFPRTSVKFE